MKQTETQLVKQILNLAPFMLPGYKLWRQNTGAVKIPETNRFVRFGIPGQADITGITPNGRRVEIEVKQPGKKQTPSQKTFQAMITENGGIYMVATSFDDVLKLKEL